MRTLAVLISVAVLAGCRDVVPIDNGTSPVTGYEIQGTVTDSTGHPIFGVAVRLAYTYVFYDSTPPGPTTVIVPHAGALQVGIYDKYSNLVRTLYDGPAAAGATVDRSWNRVDSLGRAVGSGVYYYDVALDGGSILDYPILVDSAATAYTDNTGSFTIGDAFFPVGAIAPRFGSGGTFLGNFIVYDRVNLLFSIDSRSGSQTVAVTTGNAAIVKQVL